MSVQPARALLCLVLACALALSGCVTSVEIDRSRLTEPAAATATVEVGIFETTDEVRKDVVTSRTVISEIVRMDVAPRQTVYRGSENRYVREGLAPGRYRIAAVAIVNSATGKEEPFRGDSETLRIQAGERIRATVLLKTGASAGLWAMGGVATGILVGVLIAASVTIAAGRDDTPLDSNSPTPRAKAPVNHPLPTPVETDR